MMASNCNQHYFLNQRLFLVALALTVSCVIHVAETADPIHFIGEVGGNVTIQCPADKEKNVTFFYFQTNNTFVNGYYESENIEKYGPIWKNTIVDHNEKTVYMYKLNISHSRVYECIIQYKDGAVTQNSIQLSVKAHYNKPTVTTTCDDGLSCLVTCTSHGGYPGTEMMWNVPLPKNTSNQTWKIVNSSQDPNPSTMRFNISSTAYFNCSKGELTHLSCSVGDVTSHMFSVCAPQVVPDMYNPVIIVAICAVVVLIVMVVLLLYRNCRKRQTGAQTVEVKEWEVKELGGEAIALSVKEEGNWDPEC
ncbi:T-lymphocyte activation antigen CD86 [Trachinotus anak]|uniref:T-lymphocyte activation antigen CD86 n=1 Tax=Trachinotus anak TaxID=443729 RepID=UPI0039F1E60A